MWKILQDKLTSKRWGQRETVRDTMDVRVQEDAKTGLGKGSEPLTGHVARISHENLILFLVE